MCPCSLFGAMVHDMIYRLRQSKMSEGPGRPPKTCSKHLISVTLRTWKSLDLVRRHRIFVICSEPVFLCLWSSWTRSFYFYENFRRFPTAPNSVWLPFTPEWWPLSAPYNNPGNFPIKRFFRASPIWWCKGKLGVCLALQKMDFRSKKFRITNSKVQHGFLI